MANAELTLPVLVRVGEKDIEVGALTLDVKTRPSGRVVTPSVREIKTALRKGLRCPGHE